MPARRLGLFGLLLAASCSSSGSLVDAPSLPGIERSETLVEVACRMADGMVSDPRVAAVVEDDPDDRRAIVVLERFDDLAGLSVDVEELREGMRRCLLETGRFRVLGDDESSAEADFVIHGWFAPSGERGRSWLVLRALTPGKRDEVWGRRVALERGS